MLIYIASEIRGIEGDECPWDKQKERIQRTIEQVSVLREAFPHIEFFVPHDIWIVNELYRKGCVSAQDIIDVEIDYIMSDECDGVVSIGEVHAGTGVHQELTTAHTCGKLACCLDGVDEKCREFFARKVAEYGIIGE